MKAQLSLEFLVVIAVLFAFLAAIVPIMSEVKSLGERGMDRHYAQLAFSKIKAAADEACVLGSGNTRQLDITLLGKYSFSLANKNLSISGANYNRSAELKCNANWKGESAFSAGKYNITLAVQNNILSIAKA